MKGGRHNNLQYNNKHIYIYIFNENRAFNKKTTNI